jgi:hypothetical protein
MDEISCAAMNKITMVPAPIFAGDIINVTIFITTIKPPAQLHQDMGALLANIMTVIQRAIRKTPNVAVNGLPKYLPDCHW